MAERLCFLVNSNNNIEEIYVNFDYVKGMAFSQRVKCANSLAGAINDRWPTLRHLEVSTKSNNIIGKQLSAFNLTMGDYSVESIFQSSKVFEGNIQFQFLIDQKPQEAKKFVRDAHKGNLIKFRYKGIDYPIQPKSAFYDWIYINALNESEYAEKVLDFDIFSDIEFNDKKSINCQARAVAIYVSITRKCKKEYYLSDFNHFMELYKDTIDGHIKR